MGLEIERKFLVNINEEFRVILKNTSFFEIKQTYLSLDPARSVRIRLKDKIAFITIKGIQHNNSRAEYEYEIPYEDALELMELGEHDPIIKKRHIYKVENLVWEIDVFEVSNKGLIIAEVELESENQIITKPIWIGEEVSSNHAYSNLNLYTCPFEVWK